MREPSRRAMLGAGALAAVLPFLPIPDAAASTSGTLYRRSRFTSYLNAAFTITAGTGSWKATLTGVEDLEPVRMSNDPDRFRLLFRTSSVGPQQQTFVVRRPGFTATPLFLVPVDTTLRVYAGVINRAV